MKHFLITAAALVAFCTTAAAQKIEVEADYLYSLKDSLKTSEAQLRLVIAERDSLADRTKFYEKSIDQLSHDKAALENAATGLRKDSTEAVGVNIRLIEMASNFLYIPYEDYSINQIALKAFEYVTDKELSTKYRDRYALLKNYKADVNALLAFAKEAQKRLNGRLQQHRQAMEMLQKLKSLPLYIRYEEYGKKNDDYDTYLGKKITQIVKQLNQFDGAQHKMHLEGLNNDLATCLDNNPENIDLDTICKELDACLKTAGA